MAADISYVKLNKEDESLNFIASGVSNQMNTHICLILFKLANDFGISPDISFWSIWNLLRFDRLPSSSAKDPVNWFPFKSLLEH